MSNYKIINDKIAFHPGYYIEEYLVETRLSQRDFAMRLGTTPKNVSMIVNGEQRLSLDIASKLSRLMGTSIEYWLNLQNQYDLLLESEKLKEESQKELELFKLLDYSYFVDNFDLRELPKKKKEQVNELRKFLNVASLRVLENENMYLHTDDTIEYSFNDIIKSNIMAQIATNLTLKKVDTPVFDKNKFIETVYSYLLEKNNKDEYSFNRLVKSFYDTGVNLITLPNLPGSPISGVTKRMDSHIMLMVVNDKDYSSKFWETILKESANIVQGKMGVTLKEKGEVSEEKNYESYWISLRENNRPYSNYLSDSRKKIEYEKKANKKKSLSLPSIKRIEV